MYLGLCVSIYICTSVVPVHIYAQTKWIWVWSGCNSEVDLVQSLTHKGYQSFFTNWVTLVGKVCRGSYRAYLALSTVYRRSCRGVPGTIHDVEGKLSWRTWHYPRVDLGSTIQGWPLSKGGSGVHYPRGDQGDFCGLQVGCLQAAHWIFAGCHFPRVGTIPGWFWGPLCKGGHCPRVDLGSH